MSKKFTIAGLCVVTLSALPVLADELPTTHQSDLNAMVAEDPGAAFLHAFEAGDELTEHSFTTEEGVGANIGEGRVFTRIPRADLNASGEWATHFPLREGGANATSCIACHASPLPNGAGDVALNVLVDPGHTGDPSKYLERNTLHLFALGIPQRLAEEMSLELYVQREALRAKICDTGSGIAKLSAKGVPFGTLVGTRTARVPCEVVFDTSLVAGIDGDLVVRPFGWKGNHSTIRSFTRGAAHNELGLQAVEIVGHEDGDYDGVVDELSVGDMTAMTIYMAGLERPVNVLELNALGLMDLSEADIAAYQSGKTAFADIGCASCHVPEMIVDDAEFSEPSTVEGFFDEAFPDGTDPKDHGVIPMRAITFDLAGDQPNNRVAVGGYEVVLGGLKQNAEGQIVAEWFSDFKRHDMGEGLSDPDDPLGIGAQMFLTRSLAGVGSTGPWLHDGRATTLEAAILAHGGAGAASQAAFAALDPALKDALIAYLEGQIIQSFDEEDH